MTLQQEHPKQPTMIWVHMPKAGGSTMNHLLDWNYDRVLALHHYKNLPAFMALTEHEKRQIDCINGPIYVGIHHHLPQPVTYITLLRHPVDRVISHYHYQFRRKRRLGEKVPDWTIEEWLARAPFQTSYQLRLLVGGDDIERVLHDPLPADAVDIAKRHIEQYFSVAGVMDYYDETLLLIKRAQGWNRAFYARQNVNPVRTQRDDMSAATLAFLEHECAPEIELYEYIKARLEHTLAEQDSDFEQELKQLRRANRRFEYLYHLAQPVYGSWLWRGVRAVLRRLNRGR
ncbi:MAG: sulfotransferase family 2 domain-containing protein [Anaerolineae bacterium]|nr:sulfotransferase family 2 domain-containing protein [Anaerolineae bacterium]